MSYYKEYIAGLLGSGIPKGWEKTEKGYRKEKVEVRVQKGKPERGWNAAVFRSGRIEGCWYSCPEKDGISVKVRELISRL